MDIGAERTICKLFAKEYDVHATDCMKKERGV